MKITAILATTLVAMLALTSCSKDNDVPKDETKTFFIKIGKTGEMTRAEGADMSEQVVSFTDGYLIFTTGDRIGRVIKIVAGTPGEKEVTVGALESGVEIKEIPASTTKVYLYGNLGTTVSDAIAAVDEGDSMDDVNVLVWILDDIQNAENSVDDVPVYGDGNVAPGTINPGRLEASFDVRPIASRLQIGSISCTDPLVNEMVLRGIYINGFYHSMNADGTFTPGYLVDNGIDKTKYPIGGYTDYERMSDAIASHDIKGGAATPSTEGEFWAYNFFPGLMPHIVLHFSSVTLDGGTILADKYASVAKYSTDIDGGEGNEFTDPQPGYVYTLNIVISDYTKQIDDLPEAGSEVVGYVRINIINWQGATLFPEW